MAKKKSVPTTRFETAGWTFFTILTLVMCVPGIALAWAVAYDTTEWYIRVGVGLVFAGFASAILTWMTNSALQYRVARLKKAQKRARKQK